jgi:aspartyl aminopeptidase
MAHSDYPCLQIKPNPMLEGKQVAKLNVEIYGGLYQKSWMDRPLGVAGKVIVKDGNIFSPKTFLYRSETPLCIIPSLAIHMDRELNKKGELDVAKELVPIVSLNSKADLLEEIAKIIAVSKDDILDYELFLYNMEQPSEVGLEDEMLASPRLDNITSVSAIMESLMACKQPPEHTVNMMMVFDNEEVGSLSKQGADSELLPMVIEKIGRSLQGTSFFIDNSITDSFLLSVDVAHGHHPNYEEKSDATNKAYLGSGVCIKKSVGQKYGTTAESAAVLKQLCKEHAIPYSIAINKTGISGGSTVGPIVNSHLPFPCADIGIPILAMHSASELCAGKDYHSLKNLVTAFFQHV